MSASLQLEFAHQITALLKTDPRVKVVWLEGSLGRGQGDRHSDIDLHIALAGEDIDGFRADYESILAQLNPVLKHHELFASNMISTLLLHPNGDIIAIGTWLDTITDIKITEHRSQILFDHEHILKTVPAVPSSAEEIRRALYVEICYFWSIFSVLPSIERGEILSISQKLNYMMVQMILVFALGRGRMRDVGDLRYNELLEGNEQQQLEQIMNLPDFSARSIVDAHFKLAKLMQEAGKKAALTWNATYPEALEQAVLTYVSQELRRMGFELEKNP
jgi:predicted nucleotidyltransferase